jgi:hypothetical protein
LSIFFFEICFNKKIQPSLKQNFFYHRLIFVEYKKSPINLFTFYCMKNKFKLEKRAKNPRSNINGFGWATRLITFLKWRYYIFWKCFGSGLAGRPNNVWSSCQARTISFWVLTEKATLPGVRVADPFAWVYS